jgi:UDP-glucose 4-epimerase
MMMSHTKSTTAASTSTSTKTLVFVVLCWWCCCFCHHTISIFALASSSPSSSHVQQRTVLVTGGAGYIGSHTCLELLDVPNKLYKVVVVDNLDNSSEESLRRVQQLTGCDPSRLVFRNVDIRDKVGLQSVLQEFPDIDSCIHFAGLKAVGESVAKPLSYYDCNIGGTVNLLELLDVHKVKKFVFSSSATVYGEPEMLPLREHARLQATNPYGRTKLFIEEILRDCHAADDSWKILILRYFNPIGAHPSGKIGEDPQGIPNNLMPFIAQVCVGRREQLSIFGDDYDTPDGTGVRDYIHVVDLAKGHVAALDRLYEGEGENEQDTTAIGCEAVNLGTGKGVSVLELVEGMTRATGKSVPYVIAPRRPGDVASMYADPSRAQQLLKWKAALGVDAMCEDTWRWQSTNPYGYKIEQQEENVVVAEE